MLKHIIIFFIFLTTCYGYILSKSSIRHHLLLAQEHLNIAKNEYYIYITNKIQLTKKDYDGYIMKRKKLLYRIQIANPTNTFYMALRAYYNYHSRKSYIVKKLQHLQKDYQHAFSSK